MAIIKQSAEFTQPLAGEETTQLVQTAAGDWIFPELNALHFAMVRPTAQPNNTQSTNHALQVLDAHFHQHLHSQDQLYILVGSDSGQLIAFVQSKSPLPRGSRWLFIEPEPYAEVVRQTPAIAALLDDYVHLATPETWEETANQLLINAYFRINGVVFERSLAALDHPTAAYLSLVDAVDAKLTQQRFAVVSNMGSEPFITAQLVNAVNFYHDCRTIKGLFKGKKALILAGGPSLDAQIDWIKAHRPQLFLIAVSRISARLLAVGIQPDLIATVDPYPLSLTVSRQMFDFDHRCILVASNHAYPGIVNRWPHRVLYTDMLLPWVESKPEEHEESWVALNSEHNLSSAGPTVTHTCVALAAYLGFTEIAFAGLDLCHAPNGQTHASGSSETAAGPLLDFSAIKVITNLGNTAWTTPDYYGGIEAIEHLARALKPQGVRLINPSPDAVAMEGVAFTPLADLDWPREPFDRSALDAAIKSQPADHIARLERLELACSTMATQVKTVEVLAQMAMEANRAFFHGVNPARQKLHKRRMRAIDLLLRRDYPAAEMLVKQMAKRDILTTDLPHDFLALDAQQAEHLGLRFYASLVKATQTLHPLFERVADRLHTRLLEQKKSVSVDDLLARYIQHNEPERALWLRVNWHLDPAATTQADQMFEQTLDQLIAYDIKRNQEKREPKAGLRLAEMHFSQKNPLALETLIHALGSHPDTAYAAPYQHYLQGLQAELTQEPGQAMTYYEQVITTAEPTRDALLLEHCLLRVSAISLAAGEALQANQALDTAAQLNPNYWRLAGHLAELRGDMPHAIEALAQHVQLFPGDAPRIKQLAELFKKLGSIEGIKQCLNLLPFCPATQRDELHNYP
ncbi:MAG: hypothetical protein B7X64_03555 [Halothiobacillus sp. 39-53-45]|nr:MAG: hypothetical protein B7X64_03555 [Halothiobacillus sp. 39-53-45]